MFERDGIDLDRSTLTALQGLLANHGWASPQACWSPWPTPSAAMSWPDKPSSPTTRVPMPIRKWAWGPDTPIKLQVPGNGRTKTARIWTYVRDERPWSGADPPAVWYQFSVDRKDEHRGSHLKAYRGWVHAPADVC